MSIEAMKLMVHELEYVLDCINKDKIPFDGDDFHEALRLGRQAIEQAEKQVVFKIYKPTLPRGAIPNVRDAELPWVYDQDPSSGNVASMWVTPVKATPQPQQEPVAMQMDVIVVNLVREGINKHRARELAEHFIKHTTPQPQREWVGLTDEDEIDWDGGDLKSLVKAIEAKLKDKNT